MAGKCVHTAAYWLALSLVGQGWCPARSFTRKLHLLTRQKTILAILTETRQALTPTMLVKLAFLLKHECLTSDQTFYDFVPYRFGPFSFALYRELTALQRDGYVAEKDGRVVLVARNQALTAAKVDELPRSSRLGVSRIVSKYAAMDQTELLRGVYERYPWYALKSELEHLLPTHLPEKVTAAPAVYTVGYEGKSVDAFFNDLLRAGMKLIVDVRANPASRKYGFSKQALSDISSKLGLAYRHLPELGVPGDERAELSDFASYQKLLDHYAQTTLPQREREIEQLGVLMSSAPSVLLCFEKDIRCCHRTRLAGAVAAASNLEVKHL